MAAIRSYPLAAPLITDTVLGVQYVENQEPATKQYRISEIVALAEAGIAPIPFELPYKAYTALITQIGGSVPNTWGSASGPLTVGITYRIGSNASDSTDFTNIGAPDNVVGTYFVATGTTPTSWGIDDAGELSFDEGAPTVIVLENTLGDLWFEYIVSGAYAVKSLDLFTDNMTTISIDAFGGNGNLEYSITNRTEITTDNIRLITARTGEPGDDVLTKNRLEIKVYKTQI
jgi:hypothetical protein